MAAPRCPYCKHQLIRFRSGGLWCPICAMGFHQSKPGGQVKEIGIRCSKLDATVPASYCRRCRYGDECIKERVGRQLNG